VVVPHTRISLVPVGADAVGSGPSAALLLLLPRNVGHCAECDPTAGPPNPITTACLECAHQLLCRACSNTFHQPSRRHEPHIRFEIATATSTTVSSIAHPPCSSSSSPCVQSSHLSHLSQHNSALVIADSGASTVAAHRLATLAPGGPATFALAV
jgi:hypothetical protein